MGVDNTGSFPVQGTIEGRRYLTLFVCTATRYVHVEISASLSTEDFLCALRRFSALYGVPSTILSDNGRNFVGAQRSLAEAVKTPDVDSYLREHEIRWKFQTPLSPWKGGHFERMVSIIKASLNVSLRNKQLREEEFRTAVAEAQAVVNARPLTYLSNEVDDEPLTPSHLLRGHLIRTLPTVESVQQDTPSKSARQRYVSLVQAVSAFRERWQKEYLTALQARHYASGRSRHASLKAGRLVLLKQADVPRYTWPLARIINIYPGEDGVIRSALVRCRGDEYLRSVEYIVPLELDDEEEEENARVELTDLASAGATPVDREARVEWTDLADEGVGENARPEVDRSDPAANASDVGNALPTPRASKRSRRPLRQAAERSRRLLAELIE